MTFNNNSADFGAAIYSSYKSHITFMGSSVVTFSTKMALFGHSIIVKCVLKEIPLQCFTTMLMDPYQLFLKVILYLLKRTLLQNFIIILLVKVEPLIYTEAILFQTEFYNKVL